MVRPEAWTRPFDLQFQAELYEVFHRTWLSRLFHGLCIAPNTFAWFLLASALPGAAGVYAAYALATALTVWYLALERTVGALLAPLLFACAFVAHKLAAPGSVGPGPVYGALAIMGVCSVLQTLSHTLEPVPPPWSGTRTWKPFDEWWRTSSLGNKVGLFTLTPTVFVLLEWSASPRLLPVQVMKILGRLGLHAEFHERVRARVPVILDGEEP
jgi:hypothetical protein